MRRSHNKNKLEQQKVFLEYKKLNVGHYQISQLPCLYIIHTFLSGDSAGMTNLWVFPVCGETGHDRALWRQPLPGTIYEKRKDMKVKLNKLFVFIQNINKYILL